MSFFDSLNTSATGLTAQSLRMDIISQNMANIDTTRTAEGGPYKRKTVLLKKYLMIKILFEVCLIRH